MKKKQQTKTSKHQKILFLKIKKRKVFLVLEFVLIKKKWQNQSSQKRTYIAESKIFRTDACNLQEEPPTATRSPSLAEAALTLTLHTSSNSKLSNELSPPELRAQRLQRGNLFRHPWYGRRVRHPSVASHLHQRPTPALRPPAPSTTPPPASTTPPHPQVLRRVDLQQVGCPLNP